MSTNEEKTIIRQIRELAGKLGILEKMEWPGAADSSEYDFQVRCGLATTVCEILDHDLAALTQFYRYCLAGIVDPDNPRIAALMEALQNEIEAQSEAEEDDEDTH